MPAMRLGLQSGSNLGLSQPGDAVDPGPMIFPRSACLGKQPGSKTDDLPIVSQETAWGHVIVGRWNTHSYYITGILAALLIGSIAVRWDGIKDLPGIISFALGLASLLLALIAIIQSLTAG